MVSSSCCCCIVLSHIKRGSAVHCCRYSSGLSRRSEAAQRGQLIYRSLLIHCSRVAPSPDFTANRIDDEFAPFPDSRLIARVLCSFSAGCDAIFRAAELPQHIHPRLQPTQRGDFALLWSARCILAIESSLFRRGTDCCGFDVWITGGLGDQCGNCRHHKPAEQVSTSRLGVFSAAFNPLLCSLQVFAASG